MVDTDCVALWSASAPVSLFCSLANGWCVPMGQVRSPQDEKENANRAGAEEAKTYLDHGRCAVCLFVRPSVRLSVRPRVVNFTVSS